MIIYAHWEWENDGLREDKDDQPMHSNKKAKADSILSNERQGNAASSGKTSPTLGASMGRVQLSYKDLLLGRNRMNNECSSDDEGIWMISLMMKTSGI